MRSTAVIVDDASKSGNRVAGCYANAGFAIITLSSDVKRRKKVANEFHECEERGLNLLGRKMRDREIAVERLSLQLR